MSDALSDQDEGAPLLRKSPSAGAICMFCDGCGWCEGSPAFTCPRCGGTGTQVAKARESGCSNADPLRADGEIKRFPDLPRCVCGGINEQTGQSFCLGHGIAVRKDDQ
jgi:hypothetical protein